MKSARINPALRFTLPLVIENIISIGTTLIYSSLIGGISSSSLAAVGMANTVLSMLTSLFALLTTGAAVLTARLVGANDREGASRTVEQSILLSLTASLLCTALCLLFATPVLRLLMPRAEAQLFDETARGFRVMSLSFPGLAVYNVMVCIMRAAGDSRRPMYIVTLVNLVQIFTAWLGIRVLGLNVVGVGLADTVGRSAGAVAALLVVLLHSNAFAVRPREILRPHLPTWARILRVGLPVSIESVFSQLAALLENTMVVGLGTFAASVYQVTNTLNGFSNLPLLICANIGVPLIGQLIGAGNYAGAKRTGRGIWIAGMAATACFAVLTALFARPLAGLYSADPEVIRSAARLMYLMILLMIASISINVVDPQLRAGGDSRFVMAVTLAAVWLVRVPLAYLLAYRCGLGVTGVFIASGASLCLRAVCGLARYLRYKWMYKQV